MSYKYSKGSQVIGDLKAADDTERNTLIDFGEDQIDFQTSGSVRLQISNDGVYIPDSPQAASLFVSGGLQITPGNQEGIRFTNKGNNELNFISFQEGDEGGSFNARLGYNSAEYIFISPGRAGDFFVNSAESTGDFTYSFSIMDDGTAKFTKGLLDPNVRAADLAPDIAFYVSGTTDGNNNAVFVGNVVMSGSLKVGDAFTFPTSDGLLDQVLATDGNGTVSWVDPGGADSPKVLMAHLSSDFDLTTTTTDEFMDVPFNNVLKNTFGPSDFNTGSYVFTAPEEGYYFINCSLYHQSMDVSATQYQVRISSSATWGVNGAIAFRNYFPAGASENTAYTHRLDRIAHLSGSDQVKITIRPIATAGDKGDLNSNASLTYLTIHKL